MFSFGSSASNVSNGALRKSSSVKGGCSRGFIDISVPISEVNDCVKLGREDRKESAWGKKALFYNEGVCLEP